MELENKSAAERAFCGTCRWIFFGTTTILFLALRHTGISSTAEKESLSKQLKLTNLALQMWQYGRCGATVLNFMKQ